MEVSELHNLAELSSLQEKMGKTSAGDFEAFDSSGIEDCGDLRFFHGSLLWPFVVMAITFAVVIYSTAK